MMKPITELNLQIDVNEELELLIDELAEREECACTAQGCGADACGIK